MRNLLVTCACICGLLTVSDPPAYAQALDDFVPALAHDNAPLGAIVRMPGDGEGAFKTDQYRDLFAEEGHSPAETKAKIEKAFRQLFHGDGQEQRLYFETGANENGTLAYMTDWANNDARTEGMSYGMMIAVQLDKKREFDALWNWAKTYMQITDPANPYHGYFAWSFGTDGAPHANEPAPDGEQYFAMALYFAAHRWGNGAGIYNYQAEADKLLREIRHHRVAQATGPFRTHPGDAPFVPPDHLWPSPNNKELLRAFAAKGLQPPTRLWDVPSSVKVGPMTDEAHAMVRFDSDPDEPTTDPSYHLPAFYELWARWGPVEDRAFWTEAADVSRDLFFKTTGSETGLAPYRTYLDGGVVRRTDGNIDPFTYDCWRVVSNWSVDYAWWRKDGHERELSDRLQTFLIGQGIDRFPDRYTVAGTPLSTRHSAGMVATTAVGGLAASNGPNAKAFVDALWAMPVPSGEQRYYDGMLYMMSLMHVSGNFRIIE